MMFIVVVAIIDWSTTMNKVHPDSFLHPFERLYDYPGSTGVYFCNWITCFFGRHQSNSLSLRITFILVNGMQQRLAKANLFFPVWARWLLLIPSTSMLYLVISVAIWLIPPVSEIVRTLNKPMLIIPLVVINGMVLMTSGQSSLSPCGITNLRNEDIFTQRAEFKRSKLFILVSGFLERLFSMGCGCRHYAQTFFIYLDLGPRLILEVLQAKLQT